MAKKITKEPNIKRYKAKCPICECEFEFETTDADWYLDKTSNANPWGGLSSTLSHIECIVRCPTCDTIIKDMQTEI